MGSVLFLASWAVLMGPITYSKSLIAKLEFQAPFSSNKAKIASVQHLFSGPRLPFTGAYFGSIALTIYFSIGVSSASSFLILPCCFTQHPVKITHSPANSLTSPVIIDPCRFYDHPRPLLPHPQSSSFTSPTLDLSEMSKLTIGRPRDAFLSLAQHSSHLSLLLCRYYVCCGMWLVIFPWDRRA